MRILWVSSLVILFYSCAGYKFKTVNNPLSQYNIKTLSIPMFLNRSNLPNVAGHFTKEISLLMSEYSQLRVYPGTGKKTDAILLGIVESPAYYNKTISEVDAVSVDADPGANPRYSGIGKRKKFLVPKTSRISLTLKIILIKDPTHREVELVLSPLGNYLYKHPKVIFHETVPVEATVSREIYDSMKIDQGGVVNFTKNKGSVEKQIQEMAKAAANNFREMILYAF